MRRPAIALVLSAIFPGLGQAYNREPVKAVTFLLAGAFLCWLVGRDMPTDLRTLARPGAVLVIRLLALGAIALWSVTDAWRVARRRESGGDA